MSRIVTYDEETLKNFFLYMDVDFNTGEKHKFRIGEFHNELSDYVSYLKGGSLNQVGFNNLNFDSQVQEFIIRNAEYWTAMKYTGLEMADEIHQYVQKIIEKQNSGGWADYPSWELSVPQLDLFKMWHFDNRAKQTSLKWIQYMIDWPTLQDMPIDHHQCITLEQCDEVEKYCNNDILSTEEFFRITKGQSKMEFYKGKDKLQLRKDIYRKTGINVLNMNDVKMGDEMNKKSYCKLTGVNKKTLKDRIQPIEPFTFYDCIPTYVSFKTPELQAFYNKVKVIQVNPQKDQKQVVTFCKTEYTIAKGGIHSKDKPRIIKPNSNQILRDADIASQYPNGIIKRKLYPRHLGPEWLIVYEANIKERLAAKAEFKKTKDKKYKNIDEVFKLSLNGGGFGKTGEPTSWQYDPFISMSVTIGNQFEILMLIEMLELVGVHVISANTDGIVCLIQKNQEEVYHKTCLEWEVIVGNTVSGKLEYTDYELFVQRSVNSYMAIKKFDPDYPEDLNKRIKTKNDFLLDIEIHKNKSHLVITKALKEYFVHDVDPKVFIRGHRNIYDFCAGIRAKGEWGLVEEKIENGEYSSTKLQKTVRYYMSNGGSKIVKKHPDGRVIQTEAGDCMQTVFNNYIDKPWDDYNINYEYYVNKTYDIINEIKPEVTKNSIQLSMSFAA